MKTIEVRDEYVFVYYDGTNEVNALIELMREIAQVCKQQNLTKLLGDLSNMTGEATILSRFRLGVAAVTIFRGMKKIALIYQNVETNRFAETVAVNRGLPSLITHDIEEARRWLEID